MAERIAELVEQRVTIYDASGRVSKTINRADYKLVSDADPDLHDWREQIVDYDEGRTCAAQRDRVEGDARTAEGIPARP